METGTEDREKKITTLGQDFASSKKGNLIEVLVRKGGVDGPRGGSQRKR